jgi:hypothetical protein
MAGHCGSSVDRLRQSGGWSVFHPLKFTVFGVLMCDIDQRQILVLRVNTNRYTQKIDRAGASRLGWW